MSPAVGSCIRCDTSRCAGSLRLARGDALLLLRGGALDAKGRPGGRPLEVSMNMITRPADFDAISRELAGWYLLASDLRHVVAATRALQHQQRQSVNEPTVSRRLWASAH